MKVIVNNCFGGYSVSEEAIDLYRQLSGTTDPISRYAEWLRTDPIMIDVVEKLGQRANGRAAELVTIEVPDGYDYRINDYDGLESIYLTIREDHLRELIRKGNEDDIVEYVMNAI